MCVFTALSFVGFEAATTLGEEVHHAALHDRQQHYQPGARDTLAVAERGSGIIEQAELREQAIESAVR